MLQAKFVKLSHLFFEYAVVSKSGRADVDFSPFEAFLEELH